jgi:hypothetical protein
MVGAHGGKDQGSQRFMWSAATDESAKTWVGGINVGIKDWGKIVNEVKAMKLKDDEKVADELLKRVKAIDFVPSSKEKEYLVALLESTRSCRSAKNHLLSSMDMRSVAINSLRLSLEAICQQTDLLAFWQR